MYSNLVISSISLFLSYLRANIETRKILLIFLPILIIAMVIVKVFIIDNLNNKDLNTLCFILIGMAVLVFLLVLASYTSVSLTKNGFEVELDNIKQEREKIKERISQRENNVIDTIQLSLNQITEYYTINLGQARNSYRWSIFAIIIGFITLIIGVYILFFQNTPNVTVGIITGASSLLLEFIGASNIYIYRKSLSQLNIYFKQLISIQDTMLAIELCERMELNSPKRLEITEKIILKLLDRSSCSTMINNSTIRTKE